MYSTQARITRSQTPFATNIATQHSFQSSLTGLKLRPLGSSTRRHVNRSMSGSEGFSPWQGKCMLNGKLCNSPTHEHYLTLVQLLFFSRWDDISPELLATNPSDQAWLYAIWPSSLTHTDLTLPPPFNMRGQIQCDSFCTLILNLMLVFTHFLFETQCILYAEWKVGIAVLHTCRMYREGIINKPGKVGSCQPLAQRAFLTSPRSELQQW